MRFRIGRRGGCIGGAIGCFTFLFAVACFVGIAAIVFGSIRSSGAYQTALQEVRTNEQAVAQLGEPIEPGWWVTGSIEISGGSGDADFTFPVNGSRQNGRVHVVAFRENSEWSLTRLTLTVNNEDMSLLTGR